MMQKDLTRFTADSNINYTHTTSTKGRLFPLYLLLIRNFCIANGFSYIFNLWYNLFCTRLFLLLYLPQLVQLFCIFYDYCLNRYRLVIKVNFLCWFFLPRHIVNIGFFAVILSQMKDRREKIQFLPRHMLCVICSLLCIDRGNEGGIDSHVNSGIRGLRKKASILGKIQQQQKTVRTIDSGIKKELCKWQSETEMNKYDDQAIGNSLFGAYTFSSA